MTVIIELTDLVQLRGWYVPETRVFRFFFNGKWHTSQDLSKIIEEAKQELRTK